MVNLTEILGNKTAIKIIFFFSDHQKDSFYIEQIKNKLKIAKVSTIKWIHILKSNNILKGKKIGKTILYKLNLDNFFVKQIRKLLILSKLDELVENLKPVCDEVYLFGSCARGEYLEDSDIDLLIISKKDHSKILSKIKKTKLDKEIKPLILSQLEYSMLSRKDPPFYYRIEKDKVRLL